MFSPFEVGSNMIDILLALGFRDRRFVDSVLWSSLLLVRFSGFILCFSDPRLQLSVCSIARI